MKKKLYLLVAFLLVIGLVVTCRSGREMKSSHNKALMPYEPVDFSHLLGMEGFSDGALKLHFKLYRGYVKNTNNLLKKLKDYATSGRTDTAEYAELKRRLGFEFNGMRLHEYYFGNLGGNGKLKKDNDLYEAIEVNFGSFEQWKKDFIATGTMRGVGWVVLYQDMATGRLINTWINEHESNNLVGCKPLIVMDVFEHAYMIDYGLDRRKYINAFFDNLDWGAVAQRFGVEPSEVVVPEQPEKKVAAEGRAEGGAAPGPQEVQKREARPGAVHNPEHPAAEHQNKSHGEPVAEK